MCACNMCACNMCACNICMTQCGPVACVMRCACHVVRHMCMVCAAPATAEHCGSSTTVCVCVCVCVNSRLHQKQRQTCIASPWFCSEPGPGSPAGHDTHTHTHTYTHTQYRHLPDACSCVAAIPGTRVTPCVHCRARLAFTLRSKSLARAVAALCEAS